MINENRLFWPPTYQTVNTETAQTIFGFYTSVLFRNLKNLKETEPPAIKAVCVQMQYGAGVSGKYKYYSDDKYLYMVSIVHVNGGEITEFGFSDKEAVICRCPA